MDNAAGVQPWNVSGSLSLPCLSAWGCQGSLLLTFGRFYILQKLMLNPPHLTLFCLETPQEHQWWLPTDAAQHLNFAPGLMEKSEEQLQSHLGQLRELQDMVRPLCRLRSMLSLLDPFVELRHPVICIYGMGLSWAFLRPQFAGVVSASSRSRPHRPDLLTDSSRALSCWT